MGNATEDRNSGKYWRVDKKQHSNGSGEISNDHYGGCGEVEIKLLTHSRSHILLPDISK